LWENIKKVPKQYYILKVSIFSTRWSFFMDLPMHETGETRNCVKILTNVYLYELVHGCCLMPRGQYLAISQLEQVLFL
jgi:hypothetical protein